MVDLPLKRIIPDNATVDIVLRRIESKIGIAVNFAIVAIVLSVVAFVLVLFAVVL